MFSHHTINRAKHAVFKKVQNSFSYSLMNGNVEQDRTQFGSAINPRKSTLSTAVTGESEDQCSGFTSALFITPPELANYEDSGF